MKKPVIELRDVSKEFKMFRNNRDRMLNLIFRIRKVKDVRKGVENLNIKINKGENVAIIGASGAGRSVTAKLMSRYLYPTTGKVYIRGKVTALFDLRSGFVTDFTGRYNLHTQASILGWSKEEIQQYEQEIIDFAELEDKIDKPLKVYDKGEPGRLGFAIQTQKKPEILIIDNPLIVGNYKSKQKCLERIEEFRDDPEVTLVFATAMVNLAKRMCSRGIVLDEGRIVFDGYVDDACAFYKRTVLPKIMGKMEASVEEDEEDPMDELGGDGDGYDDVL